LFTIPTVLVKTLDARRRSQRVVLVQESGRKEARFL